MATTELGVNPFGGVHFNEPPEHLIPDILGSIARAVETLPKDVNGALVLVGDRKGGANAAIVLKSPDGSLAVQAWIGKSWGESDDLDFGAAVMKTFKW